MEPIAVALLGLLALLVLIALHVPLGFAMATVGFAGYLALGGTTSAALSLFGTETIATIGSLDLAVLPMFLLMGGFAGAAGLAADVYRAAYAWLGHRAGGLAMASILGCAGFGAVCGSSLATTVTIGRIALPEMESRGYATSLSAGSIAAGGTLGILIPPSTMMVIYAFLTEQSLIALFIAAVIPSVIATLFYLLMVVIVVRVNPGLAPAGPRVPWGKRFQMTQRAWGTVAIMLAVMGGLYAGIFTTNEAAAVGLLLTMAFAAWRKKLIGATFWDTLFETASLVGMLYTIMIGSKIFNYFITLSRLPDALVAGITGFDLPPVIVIGAIVAMYIVLGSVLDEVAVMVLTLPFVFPLILSYGMDPLWWGIVNIMVIEIGLICPPIGLGVIVLHGLRQDISLNEIYRGITPFLIADVARLALIIVFPPLALWLPQLMK